MATSRSDQNEAYFDNEAASYETKHAKTLEQLIEHIRSRVDFIGAEWADDDDDDDDDEGEAAGSSSSAAKKRPVRLLDYACGPGTISKALAPYTTQCVGIDLSANMVAAYNAGAANQGLSKDEMYAYQGNLLSPGGDGGEPFDGPEFAGFDVAAVGLGFHHFDDPGLAARRLADRLRPGGVLFIIDFLPHDLAHSHRHPAAATVTHHGFSEESVRELFAGAGAGGGFALEDMGGVHFDTQTKDDEGRPVVKKRRVFIARGTKA